ncbi:drug/metabolite exporter YedA [Longimicrobium sp.]|uniref:drug/metabolite exporter YedA n=1 Tax=Longimicrobium sp. TaxID=2029185 RepID=UPI003B3A3FD4
MTETKTAHPSKALLLAAFAAVYLAWGSTYAAIRIAIDTMPPLLMAGARFLLAGTLLYAVMRLRGEPAPERRHWKNTALIGLLLLMLGNGGVTMAERTVPSAIVALLVAMVPMWMVLLEWLRPGGTRPTGRTLLGLVIGFGGIVLLVGPGSLAGGERVDPLGAGIVTVGALAWAFGSIWSRSAALPKNALVATGMEMLWGGVWLLLAGTLRGELGALDPGAFTTASVLAYLYLVVVGSLVGFSAYIWLLGVSTPALVSTYAYVNPIVAVLLGWALLNEPLSGRVLAAAAIIVVAVAVITFGKRPQPAAEAVVEDEGGVDGRGAEGRRSAA